MDAVRTPLDHGTALALGNKRYRKQVLKVGDVHYQGGKFPVTAAYLDSVVHAFDAKAITKVPFQLADAGNRHTEDPLRRFGTVVGLHRTPDGLDAVLELDDEAAALVDRDPDFGVSVLIKHDRTTGEGQHYDAVLAHVLGTTDPVLTSLAPWQPELLAASHPVEDTLDLLALTSSAPRDDDTTRKAPMADTLAPEELAVLRSILARFTVEEPAAPAAPVVEPKADEPAAAELAEAKPDDAPDETPDGAEFTDEELAAMVATLDDTPADKPELVAASNDADSGEQLELSHKLQATEQRNQDLELRLAQVEAANAKQAYEAERLRLAQTHGIPPRVTDIVRPLLEGSGGRKLALANGSEADVAALIRKFVAELATTPRLDLSHPVGSGTGVDIDTDEDAAAKQRAELVALARQSMS